MILGFFKYGEQWMKLQIQIFSYQHLKEEFLLWYGGALGLTVLEILHFAREQSMHSIMWQFLEKISLKVPRKFMAMKTINVYFSRIMLHAIQLK